MTQENMIRYTCDFCEREDYFKSEKVAMDNAGWLKVNATRPPGMEACVDNWKHLCPQCNAKTQKALEDRADKRRKEQRES